MDNKESDLLAALEILIIVVIVGGRTRSSSRVLLRKSEKVENLILDLFDF